MWGVDKSPLQKWAVTGPDALLAADRFFTNDMRSMRPGQVRYGAFCDDDGRMLGDGTVFALAADSCWVITALEGDGDALLRGGRRARVRHPKRHRRGAQPSAAGPESRSVLGMLSDADVASLRYYHCTPEPIDVAGEPVLVARCGYSGELGYELYCSRPRRSVYGTRSLPPGGSHHTGWTRSKRCARSRADLHRPRLPGRGDDPYEVNLDRVVRLEKTGFRGCEALRRIAAAPPRRLTTLFVDGGEVPITAPP